jgi:hypothetical protein
MILIIEALIFLLKRIQDKEKMDYREEGEVSDFIDGLWELHKDWNEATTKRHEH